MDFQNFALNKIVVEKFRGYGQPTKFLGDKKHN